MENPMDAEVPNETPLPGFELSEDDGRAVFEGFIRRFRRRTPCVENIPTHCDFAKVGSIFWGWLFDQQWIPGNTKVYYVQESGWMQHYPQDVRRASMQDVRDYLCRRPNRRPIDTYIMDTAFSWCIAITHDDRCLTGMPVDDSCGEPRDLPGDERI